MEKTIKVLRNLRHPNVERVLAYNINSDKYPVAKVNIYVLTPSLIENTASLWIEHKEKRACGASESIYDI